MTTQKQLNVYYIDDEELLLEAFADRFSTTQIKISTFSKYQDLLNAVKTNLPDVVVLDYLMPGMKGDAIAQILPQSISKIMVTGNLDKKADHLFELVFTKPFPEKEIEQYFQSKFLQKYSK